MAHIENRFRELLEIKQRQDKRKWTYRDIYEETGISPATLSRFAQQTHNQYGSEALAKLCEFLGCTIGELLILVDDDDQGQPVAVALA